jgi:peptidoglycan hydrolase CwlO-like protein
VKKILFLLFFIFVSFQVSNFKLKIVLAEACDSSCSSTDECQKKIDECNKLLKISADATKPHEQRATELQASIDNISKNMTGLIALIDKSKKIIAEQENKLSGEQKIFEEKIRGFYVRNYAASVVNFLPFLLSDGTADSLRDLTYRQNEINRDKQEITSLVLQIIGLNDSRKKYEENKTNLEITKKNLEEVLAPIKKLVDEAKKYQSQLAQTSAGLSARQQQLLAEKTGNFSTTVGDVPPADDPASRPDYNPGFSPAFAGFSFGAPHRKGMSQYGSYGRAKSGQNAEEILRAYYPGTDLKKDYSTGINIRVNGYGTYNIEDYVKRIYEVPNSWGDNGGYEALKAQAVAARSYALAYTNNGSGSICATESCQVFQPGNKGGNWERAVNDTRGWVLMAGGGPYSAWYAASSGGYNTPGGWDTKCGNQGCWTGDAYEKIASSPWFYKAWYKPRGASGTRSHPWLNKDEFADIVNAVIMYKKDSGSISHLSQTDKANSDTWSRDTLRNNLGGDAINNVDSVSVTYSTGGYTSNVKLQTDKGEKNFDGGDFRQIFNIRAPGEIYLASSLFNIEKK